MNDVVGIFYETPEGTVLKTYGFRKDPETKKNVVLAYTEDGTHVEISDEDFQTWRPRQDLKLFPGSTDKCLPYVFDLLYDIKYLSQLKRHLEYGCDEQKELIALMKKEKIYLKGFVEEKSTEENSNCLSGYRCPECGSTGPFRAASTCMMVWDDDGTDEATDCELLKNGACTCLCCEHSATVADFEDVDNDGRFKDCTECGDSHCIESMVVTDAGWLCKTCVDRHNTPGREND